MGFHCTGLGGSIVLGWEVPLYWAGRFHCTGLLGSIVLGWEVPLYWAGQEVLSAKCTRLVVPMY